MFCPTIFNRFFMKKHLFAILLGIFWMVSCKNEPAKPAQSAEQPAPVVQSPAPVSEPTTNIPEPKKDISQPAVPQKPDPAPQPLANAKPAVGDQQNATPPAAAARPAAPKGKQPAPRAALPDDAMCFVAREPDGRVFEVRLAMVDEKKVMGDLLISNVQTGEFVQGRLNGERREKGQFLLSWAFNGDDNIRHITNVSYLLDGNKLIQKSRDAEDEGRVHLKLDCSKMK